MEATPWVGETELEYSVNEKGCREAAFFLSSVRGCHSFATRSRSAMASLTVMTRGVNCRRFDVTAAM